MDVNECQGLKLDWSRVVYESHKSGTTLLILVRQIVVKNTLVKVLKYVFPYIRVPIQST